MIASIHDRFYLNVQALRTAAAAAATSLRLLGQQSWSIPDPGGWSGNPLDVPGLTAAFDRRQIDTEYTTLLGTTGKVGDCASLRLQSAHIAARERAYRTRHCSFVRSFLHASARHAGRAHPLGAFQGIHVGQVQSLIIRGRSANAK